MAERRKRPTLSSQACCNGASPPDGYGWLSLFFLTSTLVSWFILPALLVCFSWSAQVSTSTVLHLCSGRGGSLTSFLARYCILVSLRIGMLFGPLMVLIIWVWLGVVYLCYVWPRVCCLGFCLPWLPFVPWGLGSSCFFIAVVKSEVVFVFRIIEMKFRETECAGRQFSARVQPLLIFR